MVRIKIEEIARLRLMRGLRYEKDLATVVGVSRQHLNTILNKDAADSIALGTAWKICRALSTPDDPCRIEDVFEWVSE